MRTPQDVADLLNSLRSRSTAIVEGSLAGGANPNQTATFTYQINGQTRTAIGVALTVCPPGKVTALRLSDGSWAISSNQFAQPTRTVVHELRHRRPNPPPIGKVRILYAIREVNPQGDAITTVYVGGNRFKPKKIVSTEAEFGTSTGQGEGTINGLSRDRWVVQLAFADVADGGEDITIVTASGNQVEILRQSIDSRVSAFGGLGSHRYQLGYGFYSIPSPRFDRGGYWGEALGNGSETGASLAIYKGQVLSAPATAVRAGDVVQYTVNNWVYPGRSIPGYDDGRGNVDITECILMESRAQSAIVQRIKLTSGVVDPEAGYYLMNDTTTTKLNGVDALFHPTTFIGNFIAAVEFGDESSGPARRVTVKSWRLEGDTIVPYPDRKERLIGSLGSGVAATYTRT